MQGGRGEAVPGACMEIRLHGRGGQGGVSCAKILATIYAKRGRSVQTFGDYAGERAGAPVRAYLRTADAPIPNRNKVYHPDHVLVLDPSLLTEDAVGGLSAGGTLLINSPDPPGAFLERFPGFRVATVDATAIARRHRIGSRSLVIVNTTIVGAFARAFDLPFDLIEEAYRGLGLLSNLDAAREAYEGVRFQEAGGRPARAAHLPPQSPPRADVLPLPSHVESLPPGLKTGNWRSQTPGYVRHLAPCSAVCPAGNDVVGFVRALAARGEEAAAGILCRTTPLAAVCGRVCPAPCMTDCNRQALGGAVDIRGLERWIADRVPVARTASRSARGGRVVVLGGGPAGLGAAYALATAGHAVVLLEADAALGGILRTGIPSYRLPREVLDREVAGILGLGIEVRCGERVDRARLAGLAQDYDALVLATGLQRPNALDLPGASLGGVEQGLRFLRRVNLEGGERLSGHVVVLGGGNTAIDCARSALRSGAGRVTVAYRRSRGEMPAIAGEVAEAEAEGVVFLFQRQPLAFQGNARVREVLLAEVEMGPPDATGRRSPKSTSRSHPLPCDAVLLALGQAPDLSLLPEGWALREGRVWHGETPLAVFVAGDLDSVEGTVAHAIGSGRRAANRAMEALGAPVSAPTRPEGPVVPVSGIRLGHFERMEPARGRHLPAGPRALQFQEVNLGLADASEAHRCFSCGSCTHCDTCLVYCPEGVIRRQDGTYMIDVDFCKGCGLCVSECPRNAMEMVL